MPLTLYGSPASPFARTVNIASQELGLSDDVRVEAMPVKPTEPNRAYQQVNPLRRVPSLKLEDGTVIVDSPVICEYLAERVGDTRLFARGAPDRWRVLRDYAMARQMAELAVAARYEGFVRPPDRRWDAWTEDLMDKIEAGLGYFNTVLPERGRLTIADIALAVPLDYLTSRFAVCTWLRRAPYLVPWWEPLAARPSFQSTRPVG